MLSQEQIVEIEKLLDSGLSKKEVSLVMNVSIGSVFKYSKTTLHLPQPAEDNINTNQNSPSVSRILIPYIDFISEQIKRKIYNSTKIYQNLVQQGFKGSYSLVNNYIRTKELEYNPHKIRIYERSETNPGIQAQVDWGTFGKIKIGEKVLNLYIFVYVLSYSRIMYAEFTVSQKQYTFQECHIHAFEKLGIPKKIRYDNIKTVIISRNKEDKRPFYNFEFSNFAHYYHFEIDVCPPYYPQSKGKVEAGVKYLRNNFMVGELFNKIFSSIEELNSKLQIWLEKVANKRIHNKTNEQPIKLWEKEKEFLFIIDNYPKYQNNFLSSRRASQNSMVTYKRSAYWVPQKYARKKINIKEVNNNGIIKLKFYFQDKKIIEHSIALTIGSWILPKNNIELSDSNKFKKQKLENMEVEVRNLEYYDQFIKI